ILAGSTGLSGTFSAYPDGQQFVFNGHALKINYLGSPDYNVVLTAVEAPSITSADHTTFTVGTMGTFMVTTGQHFPTLETISKSGSLPSGVTFVDNGNGTATLSGIPGAGMGGMYSFTITASNGV